MYRCSKEMCSRDLLISSHRIIRLTHIERMMADNNKGQDKQVDGELEYTRDRDDEPAPVHDETGERLGDFDDALDHHDYPMTTVELIEAHGDREVETKGGRTSIEEVLAPVDNKRYESADDVRNRIQGLIRRG